MAAPAIGAGTAVAGAQATTHAATEGDFERRLREGEVEQARLEAEVLQQIKLPVATKATEVLIRHIRESSQKDPATAANVLRAWMNDTGGKIT
jgi:flagellar biosynthesis/type III secretory pathway M-ring protein FliF/YscJ